MSHELASDADSLFEQALAKRPDANFLPLARSLTDVRRVLPDRLGDLIEQSSLNQRRAYYLIEIAEHLLRLEAQGIPLNEGQLQRIGWGKLRVIARHLTPDNADQWLKLAERQTIRELVAHLPGERKPLKDHQVLLHFTAEQYQIFEDAILRHGAAPKPKGRGLQNKEEAILTLIERAERDTKPSGS
ncbi:MAG TPA: hypothetical protein VHL98_21275 [Microvirga sp.]|jgi:hypothetical protein|nr:hypothetical protein [Microvirga sp.]